MPKVKDFQKRLNALPPEMQYDFIDDLSETVENRLRVFEVQCKRKKLEDMKAEANQPLLLVRNE